MLHANKLSRYILIIVVLLVAFALRIVAIDQVPAGLSHDEAYNGVTAIEVLNGQRGIFFEINKGIEPLIIYLEALAFAAFGIGPVQLRLVNIAFGMLTVALVYPVTARLFNRRIALLAMTGLAISFWAVFVSRLTLRAVLLPPLLLLLLYFLWRALEPLPSSQATTRSGKPDAAQTPVVSLLFFALSGLVAGIIMYTYLSSRFVPFVVLTVFGYCALRRRLTRRHWAGLILHLVIWLVIFAPLANYFIENRESFTRRADQVSMIPYALNGDFEPVLKNTLRTLGMFTFKGDTTDRYNLDGRPVFDWINGLFFYVGLGLILWRLFGPSSRASVFLLSATFFMLLPDFITDDSPHFLRTIGALPFTYIYWAVGLDFLLRQLAQIKNFGALALNNVPVAEIALVTVLAFTTLHTGYDYFIRWSTAPEARHIYGADIAEIARYLKNTPNEDLPAISAEYYRDLDPFRFMLHFNGRPPFTIWFDGSQTLAFPPAQSGLSPRYIFPRSAPPAELWADLLDFSPAESGQAYELYRLPESSPLGQLQDDLEPVGVAVNGDLILQGYQVIGNVVNGETFQILLAWQALRALPPGTDYTFQIQLRDAQGQLWLATDGNGYDPDDWLPGVSALQLLTTRLPADFPPRTYRVLAQVIDRRQAQALPAGSGETLIALGRVQSRLSAAPKPVDPDRLPNPRSLVEDIQAKLTGVALRGYKLDQRVVHPEDDLLITLHWQVLDQPQQPYQLQFFLVDDAFNRVYEWPLLEPLAGEWPTTSWPEDYWLKDQLSLPIDREMPRGTFNLRGRWLDSTAESRPSFSPENSFALGVLRIGAGE